MVAQGKGCSVSRLTSRLSSVVLAIKGSASELIRVRACRENCVGLGFRL